MQSEDDWDDVEDETENEDGSEDDIENGGEEEGGDGNGWELLSDDTMDGKNVVVSALCCPLLYGLLCCKALFVRWRFAFARIMVAFLLTCGIFVV